MPRRRALTEAQLDSLLALPTDETMNAGPGPPTARRPMLAAVQAALT